MTTICVTGSTAGIGLETARLLARQAGPGDTLLVHARSEQRGRAVAEVMEDEGEGRVRLVAGDLADLRQVHALAAQIADAGELDALVHNAGVWVRGDVPRRTADGFETTFAVNVLAAHLLTELLRAPLEAAGGRLVWLGSGLARQGRVDPDRLGEEQDPDRAYADSKAADVALALGWAARLEGGGVTSVAFDPGWVPTKLASAGATGKVEDAAEALRALVCDPGLAGRSGTYWKGGRAIAVPPGLRDPGLRAALLEACDRAAATVEVG